MVYSKISVVAALASWIVSASFVNINCAFVEEQVREHDLSKFKLLKVNASCMLVFGDSSVDAGNNNRLSTASKANFPPYGRDFFGHLPTGRFSNGRLTTDILAEKIGMVGSIPAFLDPHLRPEQLVHGVSFASGSAGYDEITSSSAGVLSLSKQIEEMLHYKIHLAKVVGHQKAEEIIRNAVVIVSAGTNDFVVTYYLGSNRTTQFTVSQYEDFLIKSMSNYLKRIHRIGATRFVVVGLPPMGCFPVVRSLFSLNGDCSKTYNDVAESFNTKLVSQLSALTKTLKIRAGYLDIYRVISDAIDHPKKYGFEETAKGCVGTGLTEYGMSCKAQRTCTDPSKYVYWDAIHPTEKMYTIIADYALSGVLRHVLS